MVLNTQNKIGVLEKSAFRSVCSFSSCRRHFQDLPTQQFVPNSKYKYAQISDAGKARLIRSVLFTKWALSNVSIILTQT